MTTDAHFLTALRMEKVGRYDWRLTDDLVFQSARLRGLIVLPADSVIDLASTPRAIWWLLPKSGQYDYGVSLHDGGYRGLLRTIDGQRIRLIRRLCDLLMDEANEATGVNDVERALLFRGVRLFGGGSYRGVPDGH